MDQASMRCCARIGCSQSVKKPTSKYCSRACCAKDPERIQRLRDTTRRRLLPLARQLDFETWMSDEGLIETLCRDNEEAPAGLSRLAV
jgi:hypothetical protein